MNERIDDVLTLAREAEVEPEPVAFGAAAREAWTVVEGEGTFELAETATIRADRDRLVRLLENLFANSVEHGGEDVTVWAGTTEEGFYMADDGVGIPPERREEVFESGFSTAEAGTGLGLGIVAELVEAHGWEIEIDESEAGGARFEVTGVAFP
ncbi:sensor histidine kinase [Halobacteriales archaeon QS_1_68_17]|nr:MAG: sensor histidine kinase [Halobacteriales archaeon QS_1_68_17]